jgi:hypothetical protein
MDETHLRWLAMCTGPALKEAFQRQSEADMDLFLRLRAREFAVNGLLLIIVPGTMGDLNTCQGLVTAINDAATALAEKGRIDASLLEDFMFPVYLATEDVSCNDKACFLFNFNLLKARI